MSVKAMTWVFQHSPYELGQRLVHLALADVANDDYDNRLWLTRELVAKKCKVSVSTVARSVASMVAAGYLEVVTPGGGRGKPTEYRMIFPEEPPQYDTVCEPETVSSQQETVSSRRETVSSATTAPLTNSRNAREATQGAKPPEANVTPLRPKGFTDTANDDGEKLLALAMQQPIKPPLRRKALAIIVSALRNGHTYASVDRAIRAGVGVWTYPGLCTSIAQTTPRNGNGSGTVGQDTSLLWRVVEEDYRAAH